MGNNFQQILHLSTVIQSEISAKQNCDKCADDSDIKLLLKKDQGEDELSQSVCSNSEIINRQKSYKYRGRESFSSSLLLFMVAVTLMLILQLCLFISVYLSQWHMSPGHDYTGKSNNYLHFTKAPCFIFHRWLFSDVEQQKKGIDLEVTDVYLCWIRIPMCVQEPILSIIISN